MEYPKVDFLYLSEEDMVAAGVKDMGGCIEAMEEMFKLMKAGNYRMGGANHRFRKCLLTVLTAALWQCLHTWADDSTWQE